MKIICTSDGIVSVFKSQCEEMPAPLSVDMCWRIVWLVKVRRDWTYYLQYFTPISTECQFSFLSDRKANHLCVTSLNRNEANILMEYVFRFPGVYLREAVKYIDSMSEGHFSAASLWRCLKRHAICIFFSLSWVFTPMHKNWLLLNCSINFSIRLFFTELRRFAVGRRDDRLIEKFMRNISLFTAEEMFFLDEAGFLSKK